MGLTAPHLTEGSPAATNPPARRLTGITRPRLEVYRPARPNGAAFLIIPGGGYRHVSVELEGEQIARACCDQGITAFVLIYRLPGEGWQDAANVPLADAQRAMRIIRHRSKAYGIDPDRIGAIGFSAGGHLCGSLVTRSTDVVYKPVDDLDTLNTAPNLFAAIYPVVSMRPEIAHKGSALLLLGKDPTPDQIVAYSVDERVSSAAPPAFLVHAEDDPSVSVTHTLALRAALKAHNVRVETHLFPTGGHGFGLKSSAPHWFDLFLRFLMRQGLLASADSKANRS
ncbi:alpha/beta hydrolase [Asticcacaulis sp. BYS171W]|uniref:Alpha/beta hydrolase n=1 Tax=Asticcacaulis aquaticus TaxID=2984212 RepID=A0ABT5HZ55_9CAUL|nr:alpha/beta hydrolase [Asticcacaulis aquaticus]